MLVTAVLPAEYGLDPLGTGRALGLLNLFNAAPPPIVAAEGGPVVAQAAGYRTDSRTITVPSLGSVEFSKLLLERAKVAVAPGLGFGEHGEGYVRIALVENTHRLRQAIRNIRAFMLTGSNIAEPALSEASAP